MASCGGGRCGIQKQREREKASALVAARFLLERGGRERVGFAYEEIRDLGDQLAGLLPVRPFVRLAEAAGGCDWLYLLVGLHRGALFELLEGERGVRPRRERETYVRLGFSPLGPYATLQEVTLSCREGEGGLLIVEEPVIGVQDKRLQLIVKGLQGALRERRLVVLDAAFLVQEAAGQGLPTAPGETLWGLLFESTPPTTSLVRSVDPTARPAITRALPRTHLPGGDEVPRRQAARRLKSSARSGGGEGRSRALRREV